MCGRFTQATPWAEVWAFSQPLVLSVPDEPPAPRYNIAPTQQAWVIASDGKGGAKAGQMRWGLVPHWAKDIKPGLATFNARIETAASKPTFRSSFGKRHCLIPASGYYEWSGDSSRKLPWYIYPTDAPLMFFAGLWDRWVSTGGESVLSFTVLTQPAEGPLAELHHRRPVLISPEKASAWISRTESGGEVAADGVSPRLAWHRVGAAVGSAQLEGPGLIAAVIP